MDAKDKQDIRERYLAVDTANVADVLDELGLPDQGLASSINAVSGSRIAGWAYTITGQMVPSTRQRQRESNGDKNKMEACNGVGPGELSVWSGNGEGVCYFGELIALGMRERGSVGALVDGGVRDTRALRDHGFPIFARYQSSVQSIGRWRVTDCQVPVYLRGATARFVVANPGDFVVGDEDGGIVVPNSHVVEVLEKAEEMTRTETNVREALERGMSLGRALEKFGHV